MTQGAAWFVIGTDTEIGKTLVSAALLHALALRGVRAAGIKPVAAGATWRDGAWHNEDADMLAANAGVELPLELLTPCLLRQPMAPHIAAELELHRIDLPHLRACYDQVAAMADAVVVEGVGGFRVPLTDGADTADMAVQFGLPVIMVVGLRLGCLSHALLTAEAVAARGLDLVGWVANTVDADMLQIQANIDALQQRLPAPLLGVVPRLAIADAAHAAAYLDFSCLPGWTAGRAQ
ncbi:MAG: dethiobiotin synthase [Lacisediminimonas sp.]|nr:dethiobiotin synthase [Lacisediminimonas sp.]